MRHVLVVAVLVLAGCRSDAERLDELEVREARAAVRLWTYERARDSVQALPEPDSATLAALRDSVAKYRTEHTLAERDLRRFLSR